MRDADAVFARRSREYSLLRCVAAAEKRSPNPRGDSPARARNSTAEDRMHLTKFFAMSIGADGVAIAYAMQSGLIADINGALWIMTPQSPLSIDAIRSRLRYAREHRYRPCDFRGLRSPRSHYHAHRRSRFLAMPLALRTLIGARHERSLYPSGYAGTICPPGGLSGA